MTEPERCRHPDCIYRAVASDHNCNFLYMTGHCRIAGLPRELQEPGKCPRYVPDGTIPRIGTRRQPEWYDEAMLLYNEGKTDRQIADALGFRRDKIYRWREKKGLPRHPERKGPMRVFDWTRAEDLYRHGASDCDIAQTLGCSVSSVWRWRYKYELFPNGRRGRKKA